jgi:hypothetical protein
MELFAPTVGARFADRTTSLPYDVSCVALGLDAIAQATGDSRAARLAELARAWFWGRNAASTPVYDIARGLVYDGVDGDVVSANAGAESNIEGACTLFESLSWQLYAQRKAPA